MARPYLKLPPGAKDHLTSMASHGLLSESAAATALGMPLDQFRAVIKEDDRSREIWELALSIERDALLTALYNRAKDGDTKAAQTLLAIRHGLNEKHPQGAQAGVQINFTLPAAMKPEEYQKQIQQAEVKELEQ